MKQKILNAIFAIIILFVLLIPNKVSAITQTSGYIIQAYNIGMIVNEDNTFDITETITVYFNEPRHGIYRKIPLQNSITRTDGTKSNNRAIITDINVSENYTTSNEDGCKVIKIGNANETLTGKHTYIIKYKYNIGKDPLKNADELYFNLIGAQWDTSISNITFSIIMPKAFDTSLLGFSSGDIGTTNSSNVEYTVDGNTIIGKVTNVLKEGQALTVRLTLPEEYFVGASSNIDIYSIGIIIICAIFVLITVGLWVKYGKDRKVIETVEFYPPEGYNSAEVGFLYNGFADTKSIISLLIYLADKGYLKIEEKSNNYQNFSVKLSDEKKETANLKMQELENKIRQEKLKDANSPKIKIWENSLQIYKNIDKPIECELSEKEEQLLKESSKGSMDKFRIIKLKDYDGDNEYEKIFFEGLFPPCSDKNIITKSDLYNNFYITIARIKAKLKLKENKIFESSAKKKEKWLILMIVTIFALITIKPNFEYFGIEGLVLPMMGFGVLIVGLIAKMKVEKVVTIMMAAYFGGMKIYFMEDKIYWITYIIGLISIAIILLFIEIMPKRTLYGNEILGRLRGFKRFLETAEKAQLESLVEENPEYFYDLLPYTYALGVSDVWISQFETIALKAPNWYDSTSNFNMHNFGTFMDATMKSATTAMSSIPSSGSGGSSSGGSSGGGSSGGGSGGGGGGSW